MSIAVIDFEIATSQLNSACSVGIVVIDKLEIIKEEYFLIRPPRLEVDEEMSKIHGLTKRDLLGALPFDAIWLKIKHYFNGEYILAAHNAYFDMNVLKNSLMLTDDTMPEFLYFDTIQYTAPLCTGVGGSLAARLDFFNISLENAHNALEDARATAQLIIKATGAANLKTTEQFLLRYQISTKSFTDLKITTEFIKRKSKKNYTSVKLSDLSPDTETFDEGHPLFNKNIVLTGDLKKFSRQEAAQAIVNVGGLVKSGVSGKTHYLVVGTQNLDIVGSKGISSKEIKAAELIQAGKPLKIISEDDFVHLLRGKDSWAYER